MSQTFEFIRVYGPSIGGTVVATASILGLIWWLFQSAVFAATKPQFEGIHKQLETTNQRFEAVDQRFDAVFKQFEAINRRFEGIDTQLNTLRNDQQDTNSRLSRIEGQLEILVRERAEAV